MQKERLSVEDAKRRYLTMKPKLRARFAGFCYEQSGAEDVLVTVSFLFGNVEFERHDGYISYQASRQHACISCVLVCELVCVLQCYDFHITNECFVDCVYIVL